MYANTYRLGYYRQGTANFYVVNDFGDLVLVRSLMNFNMTYAKCSV